MLRIRTPRFPAAAGGTEELWLEHCRRHPLGAIDLEIRDAVRTGRRNPRPDGHGLPGLPVKLVFELSSDEHAVVVKALEKVAQEMSKSLEGERPEPKVAFLHLCRRLLETDPAGSITEGREDLSKKPYAIVNHRCSECRRSAV